MNMDTRNIDEFNVNHRMKEYDLIEFLKKHPGGVNYLQPYEGKDVTKRMLDTSHSKAAYYLMREYQKGGRDSDSCESDEDLERLIDWDKPILSQVGSLGSNYNKWVLAPVARELTLFENPVLEFLTITPWYIVPVIWIPIIIYFIYFGTKNYIKVYADTLPMLPVVLSLSTGFIVWTLIEYSLHRWIFHMEPSGKSKLGIYLHFAIHGVHHKVPFDTRRLVFPPFPAAVLTYVFYKILSLIIPEPIRILVLSGGITGYVTYDMIHFYLHYGSPIEGSYFYSLKRYHNQHHFAHHDSGYGISSVLWDQVFGTAIKLRTLARSIKW